MVVSYQEDYANTSIKCLSYRSKNRGDRLLGLFLSVFADKFLSDMDSQMLVDYSRILDQPDMDVFCWVTNDDMVIPEEINCNLINLIRKFAYNDFYNIFNRNESVYR